VTQRTRERGNRGRPTGSSRVRRADGVAARHPQRGRRDTRAETIRARLRRGLSVKQAAGAARVLGMTTTRRAAVLAIVLCALAFTLAVPLRTYLSQRAEIKVQEQRQTELRADVARLQSRKSALADPAEVEAEARRRLRYVMPGETPYLVQLPEDTPQGRQQAAQQKTGPGNTAWYQQLWSSLGG
jgi:cell division protein FtsB